MRTAIDITKLEKIGPLPQRLLDLFWARVERGAECWSWVGHIHPQTGYGSISFGNKGYRAHRLSLAIHGTPIPRGFDACHRCDNRWCVNPAHLYVGTRKQNMADCTERGRHNKPRGETHWRAKLTANQVRSMREMRAAGLLQSDIATRFGVNAATVSRIVRGVWRGEVA